VAARVGGGGVRLGSGMAHQTELRAAAAQRSGPGTAVGAIVQRRGGTLAEADGARQSLACWVYVLSVACGRARVVGLCSLRGKSEGCRLGVGSVSVSLISVCRCFH